MSDSTYEYTFRYGDYQGEIGRLDTLPYKLDYPQITLYHKSGKIDEEGTFINEDKFRTEFYKYGTEKVHREYFRKE